MRGSAYPVNISMGLNTRDDILALDPGHTPDCQNVVSTPNGAFKKRNPCTTFAAPAAFLTGTHGLRSLFAIDRGTLSTNGVLLAINEAWYSVDTAGVATNITGAASVGQDHKWSIINGAASGGQGPIYAVAEGGTGLATPKQWTGAGNIADWTASAGSVPLGAWMVYFKNRVVMAGGIGTNGTGVAASAVGDPRNWDTTVVGASASWLTNLEPNNGEEIRGIGTVGAYLLVFKRNRIFVVYDLDTGANRVLSNNIGCAIHRSIVNTPYGLCFVSTSGDVYLTDGATLTKLSDVLNYNPSRGTTRTCGKNLDGYLIGGGGGTLPDSRYITSFYYNDHLYIASPSGSTRWTFDYDFVNKIWWRHTNHFYQAVIWNGLPYQAASTGQTVSSGSALLRIDQMYVPDVANGSVQDAAVSYQAYLDSIPLAPTGKYQNYTLRRRYHALRAFVAGSVDLKAYTNHDITTITTLANYVTQTNLLPVTVYSLGVAYMLSIRWDSTNADNWSVAPWVLFTQPRAD